MVNEEKEKNHSGEECLLACELDTSLLTSKLRLIGSTQCRTRKCRCAGQPPDPCISCIKDGLKCSWPTEDGRSAEARQSRAQSKRKASRENVKAQNTPDARLDQDVWSGLLGHDWLTDLGNTSATGRSSSPVRA